VSAGLVAVLVGLAAALVAASVAVAVAVTVAVRMVGKYADSRAEWADQRVAAEVTKVALAGSQAQVAQLVTERDREAAQFVEASLDAQEDRREELRTASDDDLLARGNRSGLPSDGGGGAAGGGRGPHPGP